MTRARLESALWLVGLVTGVGLGLVLYELRMSGRDHHRPTH